MDRAGFPDLWLQGPEGLKAGVGLLVGRVGAQGILGLVLAHWWVELGPRVPGASASALVCGAGSWALW